MGFLDVSTRVPETARTFQRFFFSDVRFLININQLSAQDFADLQLRSKSTGQDALPDCQ